MNVRTTGLPGFGQVTLGTYLLSVGVPLADVVDRMTVRPAAVLGLDIGRAFEGSADAAGDAAGAAGAADAPSSPTPATSPSSASSTARSRSATWTADHGPSDSGSRPGRRSGPAGSR